MIVSINYIYIKISINTYLDIAYRSGLSIQNSARTNWATHSGLLQLPVTLHCDETPSSRKCQPFLIFVCPTFFQKPSAVCVLCVFAFIQLGLLKASEDWNNLIFIELGKVNLILLIEWPQKSNQCLRRKNLWSHLSFTLFPHTTCLLSCLQLQHLSPSDGPRHWPDTAGDCV
jgi:hypothetical protein